MTYSSNKTVAILLMVGLLVCGGLLGVAVDRLFLTETVAPKTDNNRTRRRKKDRKKRLERLIKRFRKRLDLTEKQEQVVRDALTESFATTAGIRKRLEPELRTVREKAREKIRKVLTKGQLGKYEEMVNRYEKRRARRYK